MKKIEIVSVRNPQWANEDCSAINCLVKTNNLVHEVPFTASPHDSEVHGREIYSRCFAGEFGEIAQMEPQPPQQLFPQPESPAGHRRFERFLLEANKENSNKSFRSVVIVWGSLLDNLLDEMLEIQALRASVAGKAVGKPPSTFDARIKKAHGEGLIDQDEAERCHHIRRVRNAAAHDWELSLSSKDVLPSLRALFEADHSQFLVFHEELDFLSRQVYSPSCAMLGLKLINRLPVGKW